jgi:hypothetical protein
VWSFATRQRPHAAGHPRRNGLGCHTPTKVNFLLISSTFKSIRPREFDMRLRLLACVALLGAAACRTASTAQLQDLPGAATPPVCEKIPATNGYVIKNYGSVMFGPPADALDGDPSGPRTPDAARKLLASFFDPSCAAAVESHLRTQRPNIYVYITGYGGEKQPNTIIDQGEIMRWINERDPKALIFSISWNCAAAAAKDWCLTNAEDLIVDPSADEYKALNQAFLDLSATDADAKKNSATFGAFAARGPNNSQLGYNRALSHALWVSAHLIDTALVADSDPAAPLGHVNVLGYSMGAHAAAELLIQKFTVPPSHKAFTWQVADACEDGGNDCTISGLKKLHWSLALGLSGWSDALRGYNVGRPAEERAQFGNGGFLRFKDPKYRGKLISFNRRTDPTSSSDDTFQRGINDAMFGEYNHYAHDYTDPLFALPEFCREIDAFLEAPFGAVADVPDAGVYYDNTGLVPFDECADGAPCDAATHYLAHKISRSHQFLTRMQANAVATAAGGVPEIASTGTRAGDFASAGAQPMALYTMEQEDLRGAVELYYQPSGPLDAGTHGLFSYGSCKGGGDLMPQAFVERGNLVFTVNYGGADYPVSLPLASTPIAPGRWTHLSFAWELPTVPLTKGYVPGDRATSLAALGGVSKTWGPTAIALAAGLRRPPPTTYRAQSGQGELSIWVNGKKAAFAPLGTPSSSRDCELSDQVLNDVNYLAAPGVTYPPYSPYANYVQGADFVALNPSVVLGRKCKGYRTRNTQVFFGCAKSDAVTAGGLMDDVVLIYGAGRQRFSNVDAATGLPKPWFSGVKYDSTPFVER